MAVLPAPRLAPMRNKDGYVVLPSSNNEAVLPHAAVVHAETGRGDDLQLAGGAKSSVPSVSPRDHGKDSARGIICCRRDGMMHLSSMCEDGSTDEQAAQKRKRKKLDVLLKLEAMADARGHDRIGLLLHSFQSAPLINHVYDSGLGPCVLAPDSKVCMVRDVIMVICVMWTLMVAPFEMAVSVDSTGIFIVNTILDFIFMIDVVVNFNVAFEQPSPSGHHFVYERREIAKRYLRSWCLADVVCALPLGLFKSHFKSLRMQSGTFQTPLRTLKLVRLIRIVKLKRSNLFMHLDLPFKYIAVLRFSTLAVMSAHWLGCVWAALVSLQPEGTTWADALVDSKVGLHGISLRDDAMQLYSWSVYYAITLITTVGFGDVTPQTGLECNVSICGIIMGSVVWAYILSSLLEILGSLDPHRAEFERTIDELNHMMYNHGLPDTLRHDVRKYFFECEDLWKFQARAKLIDRMSPSLQGRMTLALCDTWVQQVSYFREILEKDNVIPHSLAFIIEVSKALEHRVYPKGEGLSPLSIHIMQRGTAMTGGKLLSAGDVTGEDCLLSNPQNRRWIKVLAITPLRTLQLDRQPLLKILGRFPWQMEIVRRHLLWLALKRGLLRELRKKTRHHLLEAMTADASEANPLALQKHSTVIELHRQGVEESQNNAMLQKMKTSSVLAHGPSSSVKADAPDTGTRKDAFADSTGSSNENDEDETMPAWAKRFCENISSRITNIEMGLELKNQPTDIMCSVVSR